jgi:hypothetical protein
VATFVASTPCHCVNNSSRFCSVRLREFGRCAADITNIGKHLWVGTSNSPEEDTYAYAAMAWRFCRPRHELNFSDVETIHEAEFLAPLFSVMSCMEELQMRWEYLRLHTFRAEESMAQIRTVHREYMLAELDFRA